MKKKHSDKQLHTFEFTVYFQFVLQFRSVFKHYQQKVLKRTE